MTLETRLTRLISKCALPDPLLLPDVVALRHFRGLLLPDQWPPIYQAPWVWNGATTRHMPVARIGGDVQVVSRVLWTLLVSDIPDGMRLRRLPGTDPNNVNPCAYHLPAAAPAPAFIPLSYDDLVETLEVNNPPSLAYLLSVEPLLLHEYLPEQVLQAMMDTNLHERLGSPTIDLLRQLKET